MQDLSGASTHFPNDGEGVRAVIWALDETFWRGTISEGGVSQFLPQVASLVVELAKRGIVSSICSKNDFEAAKALLVERGVWNYFVLPSLDWSPKGRASAKSSRTCNCAQKRCCSSTTIRTTSPRPRRRRRGC